MSSKWRTVPWPASLERTVPLCQPFPQVVPFLLGRLEVGEELERLLPVEGAGAGGEHGDGAAQLFEFVTHHVRQAPITLRPVWRSKALRSRIEIGALMLARDLDHRGFDVGPPDLQGDALGFVSLVDDHEH